MKQVWRILVAVLAIGALAAGGTVAFAQRGGGKGDHGKGHAKKAAAERTFTFPAGTLDGNPEGVAFDKRTKTFFVGSRGDGTIFSGRPDQAGNELSVFIRGGDGKSALGMKVRRGKLYVAGGDTGTITVYDLRTKEQVAQFETGSDGFLNDLVVTSHGDVFVTDSFRPTLWHVTAAQVRAGSGTPQALDVSSGIQFVAGQFNLNGIVAKSSHKLVVVQSVNGKLFRIDLSRRGNAIRRIDLIEGATVQGGDGMILDRGRLVVVQGGDSPHLSFVKLRRDARRADVRATRTSDLLQGPSTIARARKLYVVVNANFDATLGTPNVAGLLRNGRNH